MLKISEFLTHLNQPAPLWRRLNPFQKLTLSKSFLPILFFSLIGSSFSQPSSFLMGRDRDKSSIPKPSPIHDQVRNYKGQVVNLGPKGEGWFRVNGQVVYTSTNATIFNGYCTKIPTSGVVDAAFDFVVLGLPFKVADGDKISAFDSYFVQYAGIHEVAGRSLRCFDYGSPLTPAQLAEIDKIAQSQAAAIRKSQEDARAAKAVQAAQKALEFQQKLAAQRDAYGQLKMGMRYLAGDGVPKDLVKAKDLLSKSAAQGNKDASDQLAKLSAP